MFPRHGNAERAFVQHLQLILHRTSSMFHYVSHEITMKVRDARRFFSLSLSPTNFLSFLRSRSSFGSRILLGKLRCAARIHGLSVSDPDEIYGFPLGFLSGASTVFVVVNSALRYVPAVVGTLCAYSFSLSLSLARIHVRLSRGNTWSYVGEPDTPDAARPRGESRDN